MFWALLQRELRLAWHNKGQWLTSLGFVFVVLALFPIALDAEVQLLQRIGTGVIWVALLLSVLLSVAQQFRDDWLDGSLEQVVLSQSGVLSYVWAKYVVSVLVLLVPLILALPLMLLQYQLSLSLLDSLALNVLLGGVSIIGFALFGAALTISIARSGVLMVLIVLPLCVPVLILSTQAMLLVAQELPAQSVVLLLFAMSLMVAAVMPWLLAWMIRLQVRHA